MKAILISDHAKWCALMMNGKKKVEVRKGTALYKATQKLIDKYGYAEFYVCCSKINRKHYHLIESINTDTGKTDYEIDYYIGSEDYLDWCFDGKVAFKFRCYKVEEIKLPYTKFGTTERVGCEEERKWQTPTMNEDNLLDLSCLEELELYGYLKGETSTAIHISDLEIFDKPKRLDNFERYGSWRLYQKTCPKALQGRCNHGKSPFTGKWIGCEKARLTKAPQSWCYVEVE